MNPILIKPAGDAHSQVIVRGKIWGHLTAGEYHQSRVEELVPIVCESYEFLAAQNNMRMAELVNAHCLLVGEIDRGAAFLPHCLELSNYSSPKERARIRGVVINKFRGDIDLLMPGIHSIEVRKPCVGVVPFLHQLMLDEEDSLGLPAQRPAVWSMNSSISRKLRIAVLLLPSLSNFTDFDPLLAEPPCHYDSAALQKSSAWQMWS
jgi:adenosylcobyric acid synthase